MRKLIVILTLFLSVFSFAQSGQFTTLEVKSASQIPRYISLANANLTARKPGSLIYVYSSADSGLWVRSWDNNYWKSLTASSGAAWNLTGNAGTNPSTNFFGTTDNQDIVFKRNSIQIAKFTEQEVTIGKDPGKYWVSRTAAAVSTWYSVTYGNGLFVAVSSSGLVMTSPDGITWTSRTAAAASTWYSVTYGNGLFVAVAGSGSPQVMTSPDGITWTGRTAAAASLWHSVTYGNGLFVAVAYSGTRVMTSPDGITWTGRSTPSNGSATYKGVTYGNGLFVAVAQSANSQVITSPDGITWTLRTAANTNTWKSIAFGNNIFVAVSETGTNHAMTSPDGITWTARTQPENNIWTSVTYGNGLFVAVAASGTNRVMTSPDGITWTAQAASENNDWNSVVSGNGIFAAVSLTGTNRVMTSPDNNVRVGIATANPDQSSVLDIASSNKGLLIPRMSAPLRLAISAPATALRVYDSDSARDMVYTPSGWKGYRYTSDAIPAASLDTITSYLTGNVTLTVASTWYDIGSVTLPSGTWILMGQASYTGGAINGLRIHNGTTTFSSSNILIPNIGSREASLSVYRIVAPTTTTTYKLQGASTTAGALVTTTITINTLGNATHFSAVKIK